MIRAVTGKPGAGMTLIRSEVVEVWSLLIESPSGAWVVVGWSVDARPKLDPQIARWGGLGFNVRVEVRRV